jgi:hypothetical protein
LVDWILRTRYTASLCSTMTDQSRQAPKTSSLKTRKISIFNSLFISAD